jgi:hypothetical protein
VAIASSGVNALALATAPSLIASPIRPRAVAATGIGRLAPERAAGIARVTSAKSIGVRSGRRMQFT